MQRSGAPSIEKAYKLDTIHRQRQVESIFTLLGIVVLLFLVSSVIPVYGGDPAVDANPAGSIVINGGESVTGQREVTLTIACADSGSCVGMIVANDEEFTGVTEEDYATSKSWNLLPGDGVKTIYVKFKDGEGNWSEIYSDTIFLDTMIPIGRPVGILPKTGQTECYGSEGNETGCGGTGQDGDLQVGMGWPSPRFVDNEDLTVTDRLTGLVWAKDAGTPTMGSCAGGTVKWQEALDYVTCLNSINYLGYDDWRLPNRLEMESLLDLSQSDPALPLDHPFYDVQWDDDYWSSTTDADNEGYAWAINVDEGSVDNPSKKCGYYVWPLRSGQGGLPGDSFVLLFRTGQTASYATGDDGDLQVGMGWPSPRFVDNEDLTVTDRLTGLVWARDAGTPTMESCAGGAMKWQEALDYVACLNSIKHLGHDDWRLPNRLEMESLLDLSRSDPALPLDHPFYDVQWDDDYWSSTTYEYETIFAWVIKMGFGRTRYNYKGSTSSVWPVRLGPSGSFVGAGILINNGDAIVNSPVVSLRLSAYDAGGVTEVMISNDASFDDAVTEPYSTQKTHQLSSGDGVKTVYVKFKNAVGIWSAVYGSSIILDTTVPTTVADSSANATWPERTITLTADEPESTIYYTIDDTIPTASSPVYKGPFTISETTTVKFFSVDKAGNCEPVKTEAFVIEEDGTAPTVAVTEPQDGTAVDYLYEIKGVAADALSGVAGVEVQITNGAYYLNEGSQFVRNPVWIAVQGTDNWFINTSGVNWIDNTTYTITARAVDNAGNISETAISTFEKVLFVKQAYTVLTIDLSTQTILQGETLNVAGKLTRLPDDGSNLMGLPVTLAIIDPDGNAIDPLVVNTYDTLGHYRFENLNIFNKKGQYLFMVSFNGTALLSPSSSGTNTALIGSSAGYALIIQGKIPNGEGLQSHNKTANRIYAKLKERGFIDENIFYFNYDTTQQGVDASPSKALIETALSGGTVTAGNGTPFNLTDKLNGSPSTLYIIMVDHGIPNTFYIDAETISPLELSSWLTALEGRLNEGALAEKRVIIIGACYSGSFIKNMAGRRRVVITSAASDEESYKGPDEGDGVRGGEYFIEELFKELGRGYSFRKSFEAATARTEAYTNKGGNSANTANKYRDNAAQHPLLNDDDNDTGSNILTEAGGDGAVSSKLFLGTGVTYDTNSAANPADILAVTETIHLEASQSSASLWLRAWDNAQVSTAWVEIRFPSTTLPSSGGSGQVELNLHRFDLTLKEATLRWECTCSAFTEFGTYEIYYYVKDNETGEISPMRRSVVYKNKTGNNSPLPFDLTSPANNAEEKTVLLFDWQDAGDPDGDSLVYTIIISEKQDFSTIAYKKEELYLPMTAVDNSALLKDLTTYYWKIQAIDYYGAIRESETRSFRTDNTNGYPGILTGIIYSNSDYSKITGASISASVPGLSIVAKDDIYAITVFGDTPLTLSTSANGFDESCLSGLTVASGETRVIDIALTPVQTPIYQLNLSAGWNFVSLPTGPQDASINAVLKDISPSVRIVWGYDNVDKKWSSWRPNAQTSTPDTLDKIELGKGYWIYMDSPEILVIDDQSPDSQSIPLYTGWNLVGYIGHNNKDVSQALSGIDDSDWIIIWNWENGEWYAKHKEDLRLPVSPLNTLHLKKAYWILMNEGGVWGQ